MKKFFLIIFLIQLMSSGLFAQGGQSRAGEAMLRKLDQQIGIARDLLRLFPDRTSEDLLKQAALLREEAAILLEERRVAQASAKINAAMALAEKATNLLSQIPMERIQEQVEELTRRGEQLVSGSSSKDAERLLRQAQENVLVANKAARMGKYRQAMESYRIAKFLAERCLNLVESPGGNLQDQVTTERNRFEELLERATSALASCQNENAERLVNQAKKQAQSIEQAASRNDLRFALNLYYNTTRLLLRAIDLCEGREGSDREQAVEELELLNDLLDTAKSKVDQQGNRRSLLVFEKATRLQIQAKEAVEQEKFDVALVKVELARNLISRLWDQNTLATYQERAEQELGRLQADIERIKNNQSLPANAKALLQAAQMSASDAERYLTRGRIRLALEAILAGNRFISTLESSQSSSKSIGNEAISEEVARLNARLSQVASRSDLNSENQDLLEAARQMLDRAQEAVTDGNNDLANEYLKLGRDLVVKINAAAR